MNPAIESRSPNLRSVTAVDGHRLWLLHIIWKAVQFHFKTGTGGSLAVELPYPAEKQTACLHLTQLSLPCTMLSTIGVCQKENQLQTLLIFYLDFLGSNSSETHREKKKKKKESMDIAIVLLEEQTVVGDRTWQRCPEMSAFDWTTPN